MARDTDKQAIRDAIEVPDHIASAALACAFDLLHGPSWSRIPGGDVMQFTDDDYGAFREDLEDECKPGDLITPTYTGPVGQALRAFIDDLPCDGWIDTEAGCFETSEPQGFDDGGERVEPSWEDYRRIGRQDIIEALFGRTMMQEFA